MSTTYSAQKVVQVDPRSVYAAGKETYYFLSEAVYDSNVSPQIPSWGLLCHGTLEDVIKVVIKSADHVTGGMLKHAGDRWTKPEAYVQSWLRAFKTPRKLTSETDAALAMQKRQSPMYRFNNFDTGKKRLKEYELPEVIPAYAFEKQGNVKPPSIDFDQHASTKLCRDDNEIIFRKDGFALKAADDFDGPISSFIDEFASEMTDPQQAFQFVKQVKELRRHKEKLPVLADTHYRIEMARAPRDGSDAEVNIEGFVKAIGELPGPNGEGASLARAFKIAKEHAKNGVPMPERWWLEALTHRGSRDPLCKLVPMRHGDVPESLASSFKVEQTPGMRFQPVTLI